jgi:hypothetical protein
MDSEHMGKSALPLHMALRWRLLVAILCAAAVYSIIGMAGADRGMTESIRLAGELIVFAVAAIMCRAAAAQFEQGVKTRVTWALISIGAALFFVADVGLYCSSSLTSQRAVAGASLMSAVGAITLSRVLMACGLWIVVKVYRESGLPLRLRTYDYGVMVTFGALNFLTVVLGANTVRVLLSHAGADLTHLVIIICLPLPPGLMVCSVLAVIIWRYARQMGGGLVAKAWSSVLLYMVALPARTVLLGLTPYLLGSSGRMSWIAGAISFLGLALAGWALYLGASFQYEASTTEVPGEIDFSDEREEAENNAALEA